MNTVCDSRGDCHSDGGTIAITLVSQELGRHGDGLFRVLVQDQEFEGIYAYPVLPLIITDAFDPAVSDNLEIFQQLQPFNQELGAPGAYTLTEIHSLVPSDSTVRFLDCTLVGA